MIPDALLENREAVTRAGAWILKQGGTLKTRVDRSRRRAHLSGRTTTTPRIVLAAPAGELTTPPAVRTCEHAHIQRGKGYWEWAEEADCLAND